MAVTTPICNFGWSAPDFALPGTDGKIYHLADFEGDGGTLIMFICNHCPYVKSVIDRIVRDVSELARHGVKSVAICSNDAVAYPQDSFENMVHFAEANDFTFPYLHDETQEVARAYDTTCTPDFFGFNCSFELQYRGRLDSSGRDPAPKTAQRELFDAMRLVAETGKGPVKQIPSMGCSIKWKAT